VANLLIFGFAALGCEWLVHQIQYLIEYGSQFGAVMADSPHRLYMAPLGLFLLVTAAGIVSLVAVALSQAGVKRRALLQHLPARLRRGIPTRSLDLLPSAVARTALALAACQMTLYLIQENIESAAVTGAWPGLWVFLAPGHLSVIPLHLLAALGSSVLLWTASGLLRRSRHASHVIGVLVALIDHRAGIQVRIKPLNPRLPSLRPRAGDLGLRSPPLVGV
jgi:hypothetical protein